MTIGLVCMRPTRSCSRLPFALCRAVSGSNSIAQNDSRIWEQEQEQKQEQETRPGLGHSPHIEAAAATSLTPQPRLLLRHG